MIGNIFVPNTYIYKQKTTYIINMKSKKTNIKNQTEIKGPYLIEKLESRLTDEELKIYLLGISEGQRRAIVFKIILSCIFIVLVAQGIFIQYQFGILG